MKGHEFSPSDYATQLRENESVSCPDCEARFPLQIVVAELLRKNQMLRIELQEARSRLSVADQS
jgi:hypothetical protein